MSLSGRKKTTTLQPFPFVLSGAAVPAQCGSCSKGLWARNKNAGYFSKKLNFSHITMSCLWQGTALAGLKCSFGPNQNSEAVCISLLSPETKNKQQLITTEKLEPQPAWLFWGVKNDLNQSSNEYFIYELIDNSANHSSCPFLANHTAPPACPSPLAVAPR